MLVSRFAAGSSGSFDGRTLGSILGRGSGGGNDRFVLLFVGERGDRRDQEEAGKNVLQKGFHDHLSVRHNSDIFSIAP